MTALISSILFVGVIGGFIPVAAWMSKKALDQGLRVERLDFYLETVIIQTLLVALALWAGRSNDVSLTLSPAASMEVFLGGLGLTIAALAALVIGWRMSSEDRKERLRMIVPFSRSERLAWVGVSLTAGVAEEVIYRGVLFGLLYVWTGHFWIAAVLASIVFGFAHLVQGWVAVTIVFAYGLLFQMLYEASGSLFTVILVHFTYDLLAGFTIARWSRHEEM
ncbi:MAG: CPBP family intramembrane glutamic endopeptidase [Thermoanaerobaculia bacterium]|nr:CPBP family intramembrane glutamic endopeptidase [Thermoanaerobaculia bacterium]